MVYVGSKRKIKKEIIPIIEMHLFEYDTYVEPFVGGGNVIDSVYYTNRIGCDINKYLIALLKARSNGKIEPLAHSVEFYKDVQTSWKNRDYKYDDITYAQVGFLMSFRAKFFTGYGIVDKQGTNHYFNRLNNLNKQDLRGIKFYNINFKRLTFLKNCVIYLDPPYVNTIDYVCGKFNHAELWAMCEHWHRNGNIIYLSELTAPPLFKVVWEKEITHCFGNTKSKKKVVVEKLYRFVGKEEDS